MPTPTPRQLPDRRALVEAFMPPAGPARRLAWATLINTLGNGAFLTGGVIFLTRSDGLPASQVGLGLTVAGCVALVAGVVVGDWADRFGARRMCVSTLVLQAIATLAFAATHSFGAFLAAATAAAIGQQGNASSRGAVIALIGGPEGRVALRAQLRALTNVGISVGALLGGAALAVDTRAGYVAMIVADAATFALAAAVTQGLPAYAATRRALAQDERRWVALADGPYLLVTAVNAVLALNYAMLTVALPLWVSADSAAPRWIVSPLLLINTVGVVALQVRASRAVTTPAAGARALRRAGLVFAAAWTLIGVAGGAPTVAALALLAAGVAVHTAGELWQASASFELSFALARADAQGQYQGVFGLGQGAAMAFGPVLATGVCVAGGLEGWLALGLALAVAGACAPAAVAWAHARRAPDAEPALATAGG